MPNQFLSPEGDLEKYYATEYQLIDDYVGNQLWTWGRNSDGQLGLGSNNVNEIRTTPTVIPSSSNNWKKLSVGNDFIGAVKTDGSLWTWGNGADGQLGSNNTADVNTPSQVETSSYWVELSCGGYHTLAIKDDGTLWACGRNSSGQLGIGYTSTTGISAFTKVGVGSDWKKISAAGAFSAGIKVDGSLWTWGANSSGRLGTNDTEGFIRSSPTQVYVGVGQTNSGWKTVSTGVHVVSAVKEDGTLWVWGNNTGISGQGIGQLGLGVESPYTNKYIPTQLGTSNEWKITSSGRVHTCAIKKDGTLWAWGSNFNSQLGIENSGDLVEPAQVGIASDWKYINSGHGNTFAIKTDGNLWAWGKNDNYQLTDASTSSEYSSPTKLNVGASNWKIAENRTKVSAAISLGISPII